jgi:hypothetical protein
LKKLSEAQQRVLRQLGLGLSPSYHCKKQADYCGLESTIRSLVKLGLIDWDENLTVTGKQAASLLLGRQVTDGA